MAGIGFFLRRLASQDNFSGIIRAYFHSAVVAVGPWMLIVISMALISILTAQFAGIIEVDEFFAIIIYNFFFSFIFSAPLYEVSARYVSDCLYLRDLSPIPGILITSLILLLIPLVFVGSLFYIFHATMTPFATLLSIVNFLLLSQIWIVMLYLGCLHDFRAITLSWVLGTLLTIFLAIFLGRSYASVGMLLGFNIGLAFLLYSMNAHILAEYHYPFKKAKNFYYYFKHFSGLFWSGFFLFTGMWIDKVIMWTAPEAITHLNNLRTYPTYDGGMFLSYLSIIPVMALFIFSLETNFYDSYIQYIQHIEHNAPLVLIEEEKKNIFVKIKENARSFLILQGSISLIVVSVAPTLFEWVGIDFLQLGIFRLGTVGAFFSALDLFIVVIFSYFNSQENMVKITATMFCSNILFTLISLNAGFSYYGYGYCLSMILTFLVGAILLVRFLDNLTYHIFISNVVKRQRIIEPYEGSTQ